MATDQPQQAGSATTINIGEEAAKAAAQVRSEEEEFAKLPRSDRRRIQREQQQSREQRESAELHKLRQENRRVMEMLGRASYHVDRLDDQINMLRRHLMAVVLKAGNDFVISHEDLDRIVPGSTLATPPLKEGKGFTYIVTVPPPPMTNEQLKAKLAEKTEAPTQPQTPTEAKPNA